MDDLERHHAIEFPIQGFVHNAHCSLGNLLLDFVFISEDASRHGLADSMVVHETTKSTSYIRMNS